MNSLSTISWTTADAQDDAHALISVQETLMASECSKKAMEGVILDCRPSICGTSSTKEESPRAE